MKLRVAKLRPARIYLGGGLHGEAKIRMLMFGRSLLWSHMGEAHLNAIHAIIHGEAIMANAYEIAACELTQSSWIEYTRAKLCMVELRLGRSHLGEAFALAELGLNVVYTG